MNDKKTSFVLPTDCLEDLGDFSDSEIGALFLAIIRFADGQGETEFSDRAMRLFFNRIKRYISSANEKYEKTCLARSAAGAKGGRPKSSDGKKQKKQMLFEKANKADTESESDTDTDTESDTESESDTEFVPSGKDLGGTHTHTKMHGANKNVELTDEEFAALTDQLGAGKRDEYIERLSDYMASSGKSYCSHFATIRNWFRQDGGKKDSASYDINEFVARGMALPVYESRKKTSGGDHEVR